MKTIITILFWSLTFCVCNAQQNDKLLNTTSTTDTNPVQYVSITDTSNLDIVHKNEQVLINTSDDKIAPIKDNSTDRDYALQKPTKKQSTYASTDNKYYTGSNSNNTKNAYYDDWEQQNPSYNRMVSMYYQNNSTSPFASELRQLESTAKVAITGEMMQFFSALPNVKIY